jgi:hypothetical protein
LALLLSAPRRFNSGVASLGVLAVQIPDFAWRFPRVSVASGLAVQLERKLFLQVQLDQTGSSTVDVFDLRAHACLADMPDFDLAVERFFREQLAPELKDLTY